MITNVKPFDDGVTGRLDMTSGTLMIEVKQAISENGVKTQVGTIWRVASIPLIRQVSDLAILGNELSNQHESLDKKETGGEEHSGGNVNYYVVPIKEPKRAEFKPYYAECEDIILHLGMTFSEGCAFKAIWRSAAARTLGKLKKGGDSIYDAEKVIHYGGLMLKERLMFNRQTATSSKPIPADATPNISPGTGTIVLEIGD